MMLCEVKFQSPPYSITAHQTGFEFFDFIPTIGYFGGIGLFWKSCNCNPFTLSVIFKSSGFIVCSISLLNLNDSFVASSFMLLPVRI